MVIKGSVYYIRFNNPDNGYSVIDFETDDRIITAVGIFPMLSEGVSLMLTGEYRYNNRYKEEQFSVTKAELISPTDIMSLRRYLSSGLFEGVGEVTANAIVDYFGEKTLEVIANNPTELKKVTGIGSKKAADIFRCYKENAKTTEILLFLQKYEVPMGLSMKIYAEYGEETIALVSENPYRLVKDIEGVGFLTADKIAKRLGVDTESSFRISAGIIYILQEASGRSGHTCLPRKVLIENVAKLLCCDEECVVEALKLMQTELRFMELENDTMVSLIIPYNTERSIATKLIKLKNSIDKIDLNIDDEIEYYERTNEIVLHEKQKEAIKAALCGGVSVITGGPGTGKTTIIKCITTIMSQRRKLVALCAPTGRAAKRMSEATGLNAKTIHRFLGVDFSNSNRVFEQNELNPVNADIVVVDEISMADIYIFNVLLSAMPVGSRLVLVGDKDQLPSVSCGNILSDVINSGCFPVVALTEIYRQAKGSMIVINAHRINNGQMPIARDATDFFIDNKRENSDILNSVVTMISTRLPKYLNVSSRDIQVLSPMKKGEVGVEALNLKLQEVLNPDNKDVKIKDRFFRIGDKVMQIVNNYTAEWGRDDVVFERGQGVFNGDIGYIVDIKNNEVYVEFEDKKVVRYGEGDLDELTLAYCISIHKSQGSEFPVAIIVVARGNYMILTRNLLYTAVTRARKTVVIVGDEENIGKMVSNTYLARRYSLLKDFLLLTTDKFIKLWGQDE